MPEERDREKAQPEAEIHWEGDSLDVLRSFPDSARQNIGADLRRLQQGKQPLDYRPLTTAGAGVFDGTKIRAPGIVPFTYRGCKT